MYRIVLPVFESIWKRKETKVFLSFSVLYPTLFLVSTFLPEGSNFMVPSTSDGSKFAFSDLFPLIFDASIDFVLPVLALFYLTFTVFRTEADSHTMFLYKDIRRKDIFLAKLFSLVMIILSYTGLFFLVFGLYYYLRIGHMPYADMVFLSSIPGADAALVQVIVGLIFDMIVCVFLATVMSLYFGIGLTMTMAFTYSIGSTILGIFGFAAFFPAGDIGYLFEGGSLLVTLSLSTFVTVLYSGVLTYFGLKRFKVLEF